MITTFAKILLRWAAEGLSYLTLDADVKEKLVEDEPAMKALIELGKTGAQNVMYGELAPFASLSLIGVAHFSHHPIA